MCFLFLLVCHQSRTQLARGYVVPLNSHYELEYNLRHMGKQMKLQWKRIVGITQKHNKTICFAFNPKDIRTS